MRERGSRLLSKPGVVLVLGGAAAEVKVVLVVWQTVVIRLGFAHLEITTKLAKLD